MKTPPTTRLSRTFCSARDRNIPVLVHVDSAEEDDAGAELVSCLDYGVRCTGWLCPLFSLPTLPPEELLQEAMEAERRRRKRTIRDGQAILQRALKEGRAHKAEEAVRRRRIRDRKQRERTADPDVEGRR